MTRNYRAKRVAPFEPPVRQLMWSLVAAAVVPPILWVLLSTILRRWLADSLIENGSLLLSTAVVAASSALVAVSVWLLVFVRPMHVMKRTERKLRSMNMRDSLTGLLNRDGILVALKHAISIRRDNNGALGVLMVDIDNFKMVNRAFGESIGDEFLAMAGDRITGVVRDTDLVARMGGDQFAIMVSGSNSVRGMHVMAHNIQRALEQTFQCSGQNAVLTASIGFAIYGDPAEHADDVLTCAESAARFAKQRGGSQVCRFDTQMRVDSDNQLAIHVRLQTALTNSEFEVFYQPVTAADGETIVTVEALLRWNDRVCGMTAPSEFIPMLEQSGRISQVGLWMTNAACQRGREWIDSGSPDLVMSVNVSPRQFSEINFVTSMLNVLKETGFPPTQLQLEITEGMLLDPTPETMKKLSELTSSGVRFALDDFGMGYSSLAYLKRFPLHTLKMDRYFVKDLPGEKFDLAIARAVVALGHGLGLQVTAEGIETKEQLEILTAFGCDSFQGYLFSKPIPANELTKMLAMQSGKKHDPAKRHMHNEQRQFHLMPLPSRIRVYRNGEVLGDSTDAVWFVDTDGDQEPAIYLPRHDIKVKLGQSGRVTTRGELGEQQFLDLLGHSNQVISSQIAWAYCSDAPQMELLDEKVAFAPDQVTIEKSPV